MTEKRSIRVLISNQMSVTVRLLAVHVYVCEVRCNVAALPPFASPQLYIRVFLFPSDSKKQLKIIFPPLM